MAPFGGYPKEHAHPKVMGANVLVIDDDQRLSEVMEALLSAEGYAVNSAHDGLEGLSAIRKHSPAVVVLDIQMPRMDGLEVLHHMRAHPVLKNIPVILASAERGVVSIAQRFSHTSAIQKPFDLMQLVKLVNTALSMNNTLPPCELTVVN
jgi:CheY-like chemotaxis protein